jgi:soluble lytic murein transglycosylase
MKLRTILASIAAVFVTASQAQPRDDVILEMQQAFRQGQSGPPHANCCRPPAAMRWNPGPHTGNCARGSTPQRRRKCRTSSRAMRAPTREDRLRNDWLLLLGQRRDWTTFAREHPRFRMSDDREVRCYGLLVQFLSEGAAAPPGLADDVRRNWMALREADGRLHPRGQPADPAPAVPRA